MIKDNTELTITISGKAGSGKTHMTAYLWKLLYNNGFIVSFKDIDLDDHNINTMGSEPAIGIIKENVTIAIETKQLPKSAQ